MVIPLPCGNKGRLNEHKRNTTNGEIDKFKIAEHLWEQKHKASIISKEENSRIRKLKESASIHCTDNLISQSIIEISHIISVLPKGMSFTANSGTKAAILPKDRSFVANLRI